MSRSSLPPLEDDFSRALLGSAESDGPSNAAYAKAAAALGVGLSVGASIPASAAVAAGLAGAAGVARWSSSLGAKLLALGVSSALLVGAGALLLGSAPEGKPLAQVGRAVASARGASAFAPALVVAPAVVPAPAIAKSPTAAPGSAALVREQLGSPTLASAASAFAPPARSAVAGSVPAKLSATRRIARAQAVHAPSGSSLAEEVQSLDRARVALRSGDPGAALREIARYRAAWPEGVFLTEASVLEIEALAARGERSLAQARAADFVDAHPDSPQADRLRALIPAKNR